MHKFIVRFDFMKNFMDEYLCVIFLCFLCCDQKKKKNDLMIKLIECLTLCHSVQLDLSSADTYNASSPDELSFIKFCAK